MVSRLKLSLAALGLAALMQPALADPPRAVVELFTSQGCSNCPPADALLVDLAGQPDIVALSFPVDYWDYLGWKDTLAKAIFTARQKAYAHARSDRQVFTPQIIVNGRKSCIGSDHSEVAKAIQAASAEGVPLPVNVDLTERDGVVTVSIDETDRTVERKAEVWVMPVLKRHTEPIARGENRGKTITYANVVRGMVRLGEWQGGSARFEVSAKTARSGGDGYIVLLQAYEGSDPKAILGAAKSAGL